MFDKNLMKLPGMRAIMGALVVLALLQAVCIAGQALTLAWAVSLLWQGQPLDEALPLLAGFAGCFGLLQIIRFAQDTMLERFALDRTRDLRATLLGRVFDARSMTARSVGAANVAAAATDGMDEIQTYLRIIPPKIIGMAAISLPLLIVEYAIDWPSGLILTIMFPVIFFYMTLLGKRARERSERQYAAYTLLTNRFMDTLRGLKTIRAFGADEQEERSVYDKSESLRKATMKTLQSATLSSAVLDLCAIFGVAAVAIMLAFRLLDGSLSLFTGLMALMLAPEYFTPIRSFASDYHASLDGKNALSAVLEMLGQEAPADERPLHPIPEWTGESVLVIEGLSHSYDQNTNVIENLSLEVHGCQNVGIVGKSGTGKSTFANILAGFTEPTCGSIRLDGHNANLATDAWRRHVRYVPQYPTIFRMSLADNARFYHPAASDAEVMQALSAVGLQPLVNELPDGMHTLVGEGNRGLSGGEAHRVALARVLLDNDARVIVFDEPTAHLDVETELELKEPMLEAMRGKLVFLATHRLHWVEDMDCVISLDDKTTATQEARP